MKKINKFIETTSLWNIFFLSIPTLSIFVFILFFLTRYIIGNEGSILLTNIVMVKVSVIMSFLFSIMTVLILNMSRQSDKFWEASKELEKLINLSNTKDEIRKVYNNKFMDLIKLQGGSPHNYELKRLKSLMDMKYNLIK